MRKEIRDFCSTIGAQAAMLGAGFLVNILLARGLGQEQFGLYRVVISYTGLFQLLGAFGVEFTVIHALANDAAPRRTVVLSGLAAAQLSGLAALLTAVALATFFIGDVPTVVWLVFVCTIPLHCGFLITNAALLGSDSVGRYSVAESLKPALYLAGVCLLFAGGGMALRHVAAVYAGALLLTFTLVWFGAVRSGMTTGDGPAITWAQVRACWSFGRYPYVAMVLSYCVYRADIFIVLYLLGQGAAGLYGLAVVMADLLKYTGKAIQLTLLPKVPGYEPRQQREGIILVSKALVCGLLAATVVFAVIGRPLISWLFGAEYDGAFVLILWLMPGLAVFGVVQVTAAYFISMGHVRVNAIVAGVALIVNVTLDLLLIPYFGLPAAAAVSTCSYLLAAVITIHYFNRYCESRWSDFVPRFADWHRCLLLLKSVEAIGVPDRPAEPDETC
jgi:O-antigen/teichoic acid export membrane protein